MAALRTAFRQAAAGRMGAVLIAGEAGVGKSRLVAEFAAELPESEAFVLVGQGVALGEHEIPYAPVMGALRSLPTLLSPDELDEVAGPMGRELAGLVPGVGEASWASGSGATDAFGRARLFELLLGLLGRLGAQRSAVVVIEDLHWADGSTRDLLRFVVRSASTERLLLVLTYRSDDLHRAHPARPYLAELGRDPRVTRVALRPFSREELADHVLALRGALPSAAVLDELFERSEGNAFFAEELLDAIESEGAGRLPASLRDAMAFFFYNQGDGRWATGVVQPDGGFKTVHTGAPGSAAIWTHIVGAGDGTLLFYNRDDGRWATGRLQANGGFITLQASPAGEFDFWTHIAATFNGSVLFYEQGDRHWATGRLRPDGSFKTVRTGPAGDFDHWTHIAPGENGALFFYNQSDGRWASGRLDDGGAFTTVQTSGAGSAAAWTHVAGNANGALFFYHQGDRRWATGRLEADGSFQTIRVGGAGSAGAWTHVAG